MPKKINTITCCRSRFYIFEQAIELHKHSLLQMLIADYPIRFITRRTGLDRKHIYSMFINGVINHCYTRVRNFFPGATANHSDKLLHAIFGKLVAKKISVETDFFIAMSSFALDGIRRCKQMSAKSIVDHASLHQRDNKRYVEIEALRWGVKMPTNFAADWVVEKEDLEFSEADYIFVPSTVSRDSLVNNGVLRSKIYVNHYGVDLKKFIPTPVEVNEFNVIQVGAIGLNKGTLSLLDAFNQCRFKNANLFLAGNNGADKIEGLISKLITNQVHLLGSLTLNNLVKFYNQSSVAVLNSVSDGFALVIPQALAMGLPVICTDQVGAKDLIEEGRNGFVIPAYDSNALVEKLQLLYKNRELRAKMGRYALESIVSKCSWEQYGNRLANFIYQKYSEKSSQISSL